MPAEQILGLSQAALKLSITLSLPAVIAAMVTGLIISVMQAATQIQEQTLTTVPKIIVVSIALMVAGSWALSNLRGFAVSLLEQIATVGG